MGEDLTKGNLLLLLAAAIWGFSLVSQQAGMEVMGPWSFTAVRCTLSAVALFPLMVYAEKKKIKENTDYDWKADTKRTIFPAFLCFLTLGACIQFQQFGLIYTGVGKGAFVTAFYIFLTPVIGLFMKKKVSGRMWFAVVLAMVGIYLISMTGGIGNINPGDMLMLGAALTYAFYLHIVDRYSGRDIIKLSCFQFVFIGLLSFIPAFVFEPGDITWPHILTTMIPILYAGIISGAGGFTLQMIGQKYTEPNTASIILSSETVFSLFAGWLFFREILKPVEYIGCAVMVIAIALAVIPEKSQTGNAGQKADR